MEHSRLSPSLSTVLFGPFCPPLESTLAAPHRCAPLIKRLLCFLSLLLACGCPTFSVAEDLANVPSVSVLLSSKTADSCATGLRFAKGRILTSLHVVRSLCQESDCAQVRVSAARGLGASAAEAAPSPKVTLTKVYPARDLALLAFDDPWAPPPALDAIAAKEGAPVIATGFPRCGPLQVSRGKIQKPGSLTFESSALSDFGGSGSPLFLASEKGDMLQVVGIVSQATLSAPSLLRIISGQSFSPSAAEIGSAWKGLQGEDLEIVNSSSAEESLEYDALLRHYEERTIGASGVARFLAALDFSSRVEALKHWALVTQATASQINALDKAHASEALAWSYLGEQPDLTIPPSEISPKLLELIYLYNLEQHGTRKGALLPLSQAELEALAQKGGTPWQSAHSRFAKSPSPGLTLLALAEAGWILLLLALILMCWGVSVGLIAGVTKGGFGKKVFTGLWVGILGWPLSLLAWWIFRMRAPR
jgi:hypothetical protein